MRPPPSRSSTGHLALRTRRCVWSRFSATKPFLRAFLYALAPAACWAQISVEVRTLTPVRARTNAGQQEIPANTALGSGQRVDSSYRPAGLQCQSDASAVVTFSSTAQQAAVTLDHRSSSFVVSVSSCPTGAFAEAGRHEVLVSLSAPQPLPGRLLVGVTADILFGGANESLAEFGDDGNVELQAVDGRMRDDFLEVPVTLGPTPTRIRFAARCWSTGIGTSVTSVSQTVDFVAGPGRLERLGASCGAALQGMLLRDAAGARLTLSIRNAPTTTFTFLVFGLQPAHVVLPPTHCVLRQDLVLGLPVVVANGSLDHHVALPYPFPPGDVRTQFVAGVLQPGLAHWYTSEGLRILLP